MTDPQHPRKINVVGGIFAALIVIGVYGLFEGLPAIAWVALVAAFIGLWVAAAGKRPEGKADKAPDRPWRNNRTDEK